jgi:hypothetical protein
MVSPWVGEEAGEQDTTIWIERDVAIMRSMPHKKFNKLQDDYLEVSKRMREAKTVEEKMTFLDELQRILKESKDVLDEIHKKQSR